MLSDVISRTDLTLLPQLAVVLLTAAFISIVIWVIRGKKRYSGMENLPLQDDGSRTHMEEKS